MYLHTLKITLANGVKGEIQLQMPSDVDHNCDEWDSRVKGDGADLIGRVNELAVRSFVIAAQSGARKEKTLEAAMKYMEAYVFGEKGSPRRPTVSAGLKWTPEMLAELKAQNIEVA